MATFKSQVVTSKTRTPTKIGAKKLPVRTPAQMAKAVAASKARTKEAAAIKALPDPSQYLTGDTTYQQQLAAINKALGDYQTNEVSSENDYNVGYAQNRNDLQRNQVLAQQDQADDYAGRGLLRSGLYGKALGDANADYAAKQSTLDNNKTAYIGGLQRDKANYISQQGLAQQQARQDALNRRTLALLTNGGS